MFSGGIPAQLSSDASLGDPATADNKKKPRHESARPAADHSASAITEQRAARIHSQPRLFVCVEDLTPPATQQLFLLSQLVQLIHTGRIQSESKGERARPLRDPIGPPRGAVRQRARAIGPRHLSVSIQIAAMVDCGKRCCCYVFRELSVTICIHASSTLHPAL